MRDLAVQAARVMRTEIAGVDILIQKQDPYILEVNIMPYFAGFEQASGQDVGRAILKRMLSTSHGGEMRQFPEMLAATPQRQRRDF